MAKRKRADVLAKILEEVVSEFFDFAPDEVTISWSPAPAVRLPRKSIKLGSYNTDLRVILIHPALNQLGVPRYFVQWIIYHELLHHVFRRDLRKSNAPMHSYKFCQRERLFPDCLRAQRWQKYNLDMLLSWDPRNRREQLARAS